MDGLRTGARVAQDEYEKDSAADFALWKAWSETDGPVGWDSPWGRGRPGWHIECSAMSMKYLGESFDIHTGGIDNIFPHHVDEIAQSEAVTGKMYAHTWLHCAHLVVDGRKMSKSLGNFHTLREVLEKGYSGREIRYELIATHYRQTLNFSFSGLDAVKVALGRVDAFTRRLAQMEKGEVGDMPHWAREAEEKFALALDDDLNISGGLAALFDLIHVGNRELDSGLVGSDAVAAVLALLERMDAVFGFVQAPKEEISDDLRELMMRRQEARAEKNWGEADRLRDELHAHGYRVEDTPEGPLLKRI
jgi:cysteinyl-tRNA synthetase